MESEQTFYKKLNEFGWLPDDRRNNRQFNRDISGIMLNRF